MIHTAKQSAKFTKLVRRIRSAMPGLPVDPATVATGLLEQMWHFTITSAKRGDIGQHEDELIAEACGWLGEPSDLVAMLVETGWLDECDDHRLVVHDWHDHAPGFVKRNIERIGGFVNAAKRSLPYSGEQGSGRFFTQECNQEPTPNQTQPNKTKVTTPTELFPGDAAEAASPEVGSGIVFPVIAQPSDKRTKWELPQSLLDRYRELYGESVKVDQEIRNALAWLEASPKRRKTRSGMQRFLTSWMMRRVNGTPPPNAQGGGGRRHTEITPL